MYKFWWVLLFPVFLLSCKKPGCNDSRAINFNSKAEKNDGTCSYVKEKFSGNYVGTESRILPYLQPCDTARRDTALLVTIGGACNGYVNSNDWNIADLCRSGTGNPFDFTSLKLVIESDSVVTIHQEFPDGNGGTFWVDGNGTFDGSRLLIHFEYHQPNLLCNPQVYDWDLVKQ